MAIQIINGKAVVTDEKTQGSGTGKIVIKDGKAVVDYGVSPQTTQQTSYIPQPSRLGLFTQKDPGIVLNTLKDLALSYIPGGKDFSTMYSKTATPQEKLQAASKTPFQRIGEWGAEFGKGIAGIPFRLGLGVTDILGGPRKANIPLIGEQQSPQETYRGLREAGAGQVVSAGLPIAQTAMDLLLGKGIVKGIKGLKPEAKIPTSELPLELLKTVRKEIPATNIPKPKTFTTLPKPLMEKTGLQIPKPKIIEVKPPTGLGVIFDRLFGNMDDRLKKLGPAGKELSDRYNIAEARTALIRGPKAIEIDKMPKLNPKQQIEFINAVEKGTPTADPNVIKAVTINKKLAPSYQQLANQVGILVDDRTGMPIGDPNTYFPHMFNDAGMKEFRSKPSTFFQRMAEVNNVDEATFRNIWDRYINPQREMKAGFERQRQFNIAPEYMETDPKMAWHKYNHEFSKRIAFTQAFGPKNEIAKQLAGSVGKETGDPYYTNFANKFIDITTGRVPKDFALENSLTNLVKQQVYTKLGPETASANMQQGYLVNTNFYGISYANKGLLASFTPKGRMWAKKIGIIGEGFYTDYSNTNRAWNRMSGFPMTEDFNFVEVANATKYYAEDMFKKLIKNPNDKLAGAKLDFLGIEDWRNTLQSGVKALSEEQLGRASFNAIAKGVFPKLAGKIPEWTTGGGAGGAIGRATYLFNHYQLQQPKFLMSQFQFGKLAGIKALATTMAVSGLLGEIPADLYSLTRGEKRPEKLLPRILENIATVSSFGLPYQMARSAYKYGSYGLSMLPLGGAAIGGPLEAGATITKDIMKNPKKLLQDIFRQWLKGNIPGVPYIPSGATIEQVIPRPKR